MRLQPESESWPLAPIVAVLEIGHLAVKVLGLIWLPHDARIALSL